MRAGLLSNPRVVIALRTLFVPVHMSALNTAHCMHDPRDEALLKSMAGDATDRFVGGERETFLLPDGTMQRVFLSLNDHEIGGDGGHVNQYTAAARRDDRVTRMFRHHGANALRSVHGEVPAAWRELWSGESPAVRALLDEKPRPPGPAAGQQGLRVFVRNSHLRYDDLHGAQIVTLADDVVAAWGSGLREVGSRAALPQQAFDTLANAMVPRGTIDPELTAASIGGKLELVADRVDADRVTGRVLGSFVLHPTVLDEAGRRRSAAIPFDVRGRLEGRFAWSRAAGTFTELRVAATDVKFEWQSRMPSAGDFPPHYFAAFEWVRGESPQR